MSALECQTYADFSLELHRKVVRQRIPITGVVELTHRCPLRCVHCYNNLPPNDRRAENGELTSQEHSRILKELAEAGCLWLLYTGGEIFVRKDFECVYTEAVQRGFLITLFTNGVLITEKIADFLAASPPFCIEISLYGRTRETYEGITGVAGSFDRCLRGIGLLRERRLPVRLKTMAISPNKAEIWEMRRFVEHELGLEFRFDAVINPRIDGSHRPLEMRLSPIDIVELDLQDPKRVEEWRRFSGRFGGPVHPPDHDGEQYHCGGGITGFAVDPYGMLDLCALVRTTGYDLRRGHFLEGWTRTLADLRRQHATRRTKCTTCAIKAMCGMCPANGQLENSDPEAPVDFLCRLAHLRAYAFEIPVAPHGECEYCRSGSRYQELIRSLASLQVEVA